jgi:hypothetical protein
MIENALVFVMFVASLNPCSSRKRTRAFVQLWRKNEKHIRFPFPCDELLSPMSLVHLVIVIVALKIKHEKVIV